MSTSEPIMRIHVSDALGDEEVVREQPVVEGAPNVLFVVFADAGLAAWSPFGGRIRMPTLQRLADNGLLYSQWRAGALPAVRRAPAPVPTHRATASLATILRDAGWGTGWVGVNHNVPIDEWCAPGSDIQWPLSMGYDELHGVIALDDVARSPMEEIADSAIQYLQGQRSRRPLAPWYLCLHPGVTWDSAHAPDSYVRRYRGQFDAGYEAYAKWARPRMAEEGIVAPLDVRTSSAHATHQWAPSLAWSAVAPLERARQLRRVEQYAAASEYADTQIGRVIAHLAETGQLENTLIVWCAANGVSSITNDGWSTAFSTSAASPAYVPGLGALAPAPLVVSWPSGILARGEVRPQRHSAADLVPTILECCGLQSQRAQLSPVGNSRGGSMCYSFDDARALPTLAHTVVPFTSSAVKQRAREVAR